MVIICMPFTWTLMYLFCIIVNAFYCRTVEMIFLEDFLTIYVVFFKI